MDPVTRTKFQLVCVSHDPQLYDRYVAGNPNLRGASLLLLDNRTRKEGVSRLYNEYIASRIPEDTWIIFLHHDFEFHEEPASFLHMLRTNTIYGPIGARRRSPRLVGEIMCSHEVSPDARIGRRIKTPMRVDTLDSCCLIVHSSLIVRYGLRFDPNLPWHFYSEDLSLCASTQGIRTFAIQIECGHYGQGSLAKSFDPDDLSRSLEYVQKKHSGRIFASTSIRALGRRAADGPARP